MKCSRFGSISAVRQRWKPLPGALGAGQLSRLYGVAADDPDTGILLQHRAVLFGLLGALLVAAGIEWRVQASSVRLTR